MWTDRYLHPEMWTRKMLRLKMENLNAHCLDTKLRIWHHLQRTTTYRIGCCTRCARLTKVLVLAHESLRFQGSRQFGIDTYMANGPNMRGNPTARRTQPSLPVSQALAPCARQPGFRARRQALLFVPKSALYESRHALGETLHISILPAHYAHIYIYIYLYIYIFIYIYIYIYISMYFHKYICMYIYFYICIYIYLHVYIFVYMYMLYIYIYMQIISNIQISTCIQLYTYTHVFIYSYVHVYICTLVYISICINTYTYVHVYIYVHMYIHGIVLYYRNHWHLSIQANVMYHDFADRLYIHVYAHAYLYIYMYIICMYTYAYLYDMIWLSYKTWKEILTCFYCSKCKVIRFCPVDCQKRGLSQGMWIKIPPVPLLEFLFSSHQACVPECLC